MPDIKKFDFLCLFDLECNIPTKKNNIKFNEILELPVVVLDQNKNSIIGEFHTFVKPTIDKQVSSMTE